jgi:F-type H+-transporting ATPase subunit b
MELFGTQFLLSQYFWVTVSFVVLMALISRMVLPAVNAVLDARAGKIASDLQAAEAARTEAAAMLAEYQAQIAGARKEAAEVVSKARAEAEALATARVAAADAEITRKTEEARKAIAAAEAESIRSVRGSVADLAIHVAEKLIAETVDAKLAAKITDEELKKQLNA